MSIELKELKSGIKVNFDMYYKLLELKDKNMQEFVTFCDENMLPYSINDMTYAQYNRALRKAFPITRTIKFEP